MTAVSCDVLPTVHGTGGALIVGGVLMALVKMLVGAAGTVPVPATVHTKFCAGEAAATVSVLDPIVGYIAVKTWLPPQVEGIGGVEAGDMVTCPGARMWLCPVIQRPEITQNK